MGTVTAPTLRMARSAIDHSGRFSEIRATRSWACIPRSARPSAMCRTRRTNSAAEMRTHSPLRFSLTASGLSCRAMAARQTPARVDGMLDSSGPGETLAAAAADTGKRSPSMGLGAIVLSYQIGEKQLTDYILPLEKSNQTRSGFMENYGLFRPVLPLRAPAATSSQARAQHCVPGAGAGVGRDGWIPFRPYCPVLPARPESKTAKRSRWYAK